MSSLPKPFKFGLVLILFAYAQASWARVQVERCGTPTDLVTTFTYPSGEVEAYHKSPNGNDYYLGQAYWSNRIKAYVFAQGTHEYRYHTRVRVDYYNKGAYIRSMICK